MKTLGFGVVLLFAFTVPVRAHQVYSGCAVPSATPRHVWYVDPVHGKTPAAGGNGSQASPWNSLSGIISGSWGAGVSVPGYTRPLLSSVPYYHITSAGRVDIADNVGNPPVQPGDAIYLMSGNYGDIGLGSYANPTTNSDFVTVEAAPIRVRFPSFRPCGSIAPISGYSTASRCRALLGANNNTNALVTIEDQGPSFPTTDIILENMQISSADSTAGWSQAQWIAQARYGVREWGSAGNGTNGEPNTTCISMAGSHIQNVRTAGILAGNNTLFANNVIDHFGDDGIDYAANNLAITHNTIHDNLDLGDGNHEDAMQGQNGPLAPGCRLQRTSRTFCSTATSSSVKRTRRIAFPTYLQGIDAFDEDWTNITVTNNVIVTSACHGITFPSIHNSLIANNTVVEDGLVSVPGWWPPSTSAAPRTEGPLSTNTVVRNNLTSELNHTALAAWSADHNVALCCGISPSISW